MKLSYADKIYAELTPHGHISVTSAGGAWQTREDFQPWLEIYDPASGENQVFLWSQCREITQEAYQTGFSRGVRTVYTGFPFDSEFSFAAFLEIQESTLELKAGIIPLQDNFSTLLNLVWPGPMEFNELRQDWYTVYPLQQGILIPNGWAQEIDLKKKWWLDAEHLYARSGYMPWFGQVREQAGYMYLVNTPWDGGFTLDHPAGGPCLVGTVWHSQLGHIGYRRESTYTFFENCDYNLFCRKFRDYLTETGELRTLEEKILRNPKVGQLIGTSIYHDTIYTHIQPDSFLYPADHPEQADRYITFDRMAQKIQSVRDRDIQKVFVHIDGWTRAGYDNQHPDPLPPCEKAGGWEGFRRLCDRVRQMGYQVAIHDQYRDYFLDAPSYDPAYTRKNMDGTIDQCTLWNGGLQEFMCPSFHSQFLKRNFTQLRENGIFLDGAYLDVFSCVPLDECYDPLHPVTREQCLKERKKCLDYVRSLGMIISSEEGVCWAIRDLDLIHHAPYVQESTPNPKKITGDRQPESIGIPVPLLNLVYHDCIVIPWVVTGEGPNHQSGFLHAMLNGGVAYVGADFSDSQMEQVKAVADWHEKIGCSEMLRHSFLDSTGNVQKTTFANGWEITVDFSQNTYTLTAPSRDV